MDLTRRQSAILDLAQREGRVWVSSLAEAFQATPQTIRRDLEALAQAHKMVRFHGGGEPLAGVEYMRYSARRELAATEKAAIGAEVARRIPNNVAVFMNAGTTSEAVARCLDHHAGLRVITDNVNTANTLRHFPGIEVLIVCGPVRASDGAVTGDDATRYINGFRADIAVVGAAAIDPDGALLDFDLAEARVAQAMTENARHVILAADSSKFKRSAPVKFGNIADMDVFVTDRLDAPDLKRRCAEAAVEIVETAR